MASSSTLEIEVEQLYTELETERRQKAEAHRTVEEFVKAAELLKRNLESSQCDVLSLQQEVFALRNMNVNGAEQVNPNPSRNPYSGR